MATCPKCGFEAGDEPQCGRCGVIFDRMHTIVELRPLGARVGRPAAEAPPPPPAREEKLARPVPKIARPPEEERHPLRNAVLLALAIALGILGARAWLGWRAERAARLRAAEAGFAAPAP